MLQKPERRVLKTSTMLALGALGAAGWESLARSKLYDPTFTHRFRKASETAHD